MRPPLPRPFVAAAVAFSGLVLAGCSFSGGVSIGAATPSVPSAAPVVTSTPAPTDPAPSTPVPTSSAPTTPDPTSPAPSTPAPSTPAPTTSAATTSAPTSPAPVTRCTTGQLAAALAPADAPAGRGAAVLTLTNLGRTPCHLRGFGGISLSRSDGAPVLSRQVRTEAAPPALTLAPGDVARSDLSWSTLPNTAVGEPATGACEAVPTALLVIPPDQIQDLPTLWTAGPVCDQGRITQTPYRAG